MFQVVLFSERVVAEGEREEMIPHVYCKGHMNTDTRER